MTDQDDPTKLAEDEADEEWRGQAGAVNGQVAPARDEPGYYLRRLRQEQAKIGHDPDASEGTKDLARKALIAFHEEQLAELKGEVAGGKPNFKAWTVDELMNADLTLRWLVKGMIPHPTYGFDAGGMKTLKSYLGLFRQVGLATGTPVMNQWAVPEAQRVLCFVGEGGRVPYTRRLERVLEACQLDRAAVGDNLRTIFDVAPLGSARFIEGLRYHLNDYRPAFVHMDPLYPFQPLDVESRSLASMGSMLSSTQHLCEEYEATYWLTAHFNQSGKGLDLARISGAGPGEWADSWCLLEHRETPDVPNGRFRLRLEIGSRQWGGMTYDVDFDIGRFNDDLNTHDGRIRFRVDLPGRGDLTDDRAAKRELDVRRAINETMRRARKSLSQTEIEERTDGFAKTTIRANIRRMVDDGSLEVDYELTPPNGGRKTPFYKLPASMR